MATPDTTALAARYATETDHLPYGWEDAEALAACQAGRAYMADWLQLERTLRPASIERYSFAGAAESEWIELFDDGSGYVHSNAEDEVWDTLGDYLEEIAERLNVPDWQAARDYESLIALIDQECAIRESDSRSPRP